MNALRVRDDFSPAAGPTRLVLAAGNFDGVHVGHRDVLARAREVAADADAEPWVLTFDPHPLRVLAPRRCPPMLCTQEQRLREFEVAGMAGAWMLPCDEALLSMPAEVFLDRLLAAAPALAGVVAGEDWRFGRGAEGDLPLLAARGIAVHATPLTEWKGERVSSTRVRTAVAAGDMAAAAAMLGRPYALEGTVVRGRQEGRALGFPTINVRVENELLPPPGIYAGRALVRGAWRNGAGYLSEAGRADGVFEMHLLDVAEDLYGERVELAVTNHVRNDKRFDSAEALTRQIRADVERVRTLLAAAER